MIVYKVVMKPVLIFGVPFQIFYGLVFMGIGIFMGTLNIIIPVVMVLVYAGLRVFIKEDAYFFDVIKRSWRYEAELD